MSDAPDNKADQDTVNQLELVGSWVEQCLSEVPGCIESLADN